MIALLLIVGVLLTFLQYALIAFLALLNITDLLAVGPNFWNVFWLVLAVAWAANPIKLEVK